MYLLFRRKIRRSILYLGLIQVIMILFNPILVNLIRDPNLGYATLFILNFLIGLLLIWKTTGSKINLLLLFFLTSGLFIGGRFFSILLGTEAVIWEPTFFYHYAIDRQHTIEIMYYVLVYFNALAIGSVMYIIQPIIIKADHISPKTISFLNYILLIFFVPITIYILIIKTKQFQIAASMGYAAIYLSTNQDGDGSNFINTLFLCLFGLAVAYGNNKIRSLYMLIFVIISLIMMVIGARGMFGSVVLVLLWMYSEKHYLSLKKLSLFMLISSIFILSVGELSLRSNELTKNIGLFESIRLFLYDQGVSLMVFDTSRLLEDYPWQPYFQNFIPGFVRVFEIITNTSAGNDSTFAAYMCSTLNPKLYNNGNGLGWTLMSDFYLYAQGNIIIFGLFTIFFSYSCSVIVNNIKNNRIIKTIAYTTATSLLILPRSGLNSFIPLIYYAIGGWVIMMGISQLLKSANKSYLRNLNIVESKH